MVQLVSRHSCVADRLPVVVRFPAGPRVRLKTVDSPKGNGLGQKKSTYFSPSVFFFRPSLHRSMSTTIHHHVLRSISLSVHPCLSVRNQLLELRTSLLKMPLELRLPQKNAFVQILFNLPRPAIVLKMLQNFTF